MELTREQAIEEHRKMWNWIADEIESGKATIDIWDSKRVYLKNNEIGCVLNDCFLCEYTKRKHREDICRSCPLLWGDYEDTCTITEQGFGLFEECVDCEDWETQAALARQIANLPERTDV